MKMFSSILKTIEQQLNVPQPTKSRILLEIQADMMDLYGEYLNKGLSEEEAAHKTEEKFIMDDVSISQLVEIHESAFNRWMDKLSLQAGKRWEKIILIIFLFILFTLSGRIFLATEFFLQSSAFILPTLILFFGAGGIALWKFYQLFIKKDHRLKIIRKGLPTLVFLGAGSLMVSAMGFLSEMYFMVNRIAGEMERSLFYFTDWLLKCSSLMMSGILSAIIIALFWYILINKIYSIEADATAYLWYDS